MNHNEPKHKIKTGLRMIMGGSVIVKGRVTVSSPRKTFQMSRKIYMTVRNEVTNVDATMIHRQVKSSPPHAMIVSKIASLDKNPEKNGRPASALPLMINAINVNGNLFLNPPKLRIS